MWLDPRILLREGAGPLFSWRAASSAVTTGSRFVLRRGAVSLSPFILEGPRRCRPPVRATVAEAVAKVSSPEEREAEPGERGELREPTASPAPTVAAPRSVGLTPVLDPRRCRFPARTGPLLLTFVCMEHPLFCLGRSTRDDYDG